MKQLDVPNASNLALSEEWTRRGRVCDAWASTGNSLTKYDRSLEGTFPIYGSHARGAYLWDVDGNRYIDYILGYGTVVLGHADPRVSDAVLKDLSTGNNLSPLWRPLQVEVTELLTSVIPGAEMAFLMKTGSDATSGALRLARVFTGRNKVVRWGYNGWHDWCAQNSEGIPASVKAESLTFSYNDIASLRKVFEDHPNQIACVLMMPFEVDKPGPGFLQQIKDIAHEHGALFILDELRSGFRMAIGGAQEFFGVQADLAAYGKSMSNGYAISAITGRAELLRGISRTQMVSTFYGNSAEMAAVKATISVLRESYAIPHIWQMGTAFIEGLRELTTKYNVPVEVVGFAPYPYLRFIGTNEETVKADKAAFYAETTRNGILLHPSHHWYISAAHVEEDIVQTLDACRKGFEAMQRGSKSHSRITHYDSPTHSRDADAGSVNEGLSLNAAIVGFGSSARHGHLPWYLNNPSVKLSGVVEPTPDGRAVVQTLLPHVPVYPSLRALLDEQQPAFVDITAPPSAHRELILEATAAGAHVFCEKPFVTTWQALQDIGATRRNEGPIIAACHNWYFAPSIRKGLEMVAAGVIGEPQKVYFEVGRTEPARGADHWNPVWRQCLDAGGGIIGDLGYHGFYLVSRIFERAPISVRVHSIKTIGPDDDAESAASLDLDCGGGKHAEFTLSWLSTRRKTFLKVEGSQGQLVVEDDKLCFSTNGSQNTEECFEPLTADSWHSGWTGAALDWFLAAVQSGERDAAWQDIRWSVATLDAAYASVRQRSVITISPS
jgi:glutamate-1-semialdehyde 2,1-aminomutase